MWTNLTLLWQQWFVFLGRRWFFKCWVVISESNSKLYGGTQRTLEKRLLKLTDNLIHNARFHRSTKAHQSVAGPTSATRTKSLNKMPKDFLVHRLHTPELTSKKHKPKQVVISLSINWDRLHEFVFFFFTKLSQEYHIPNIQRIKIILNYRLQAWIMFEKIHPIHVLCLLAIWKDSLYKR